MIPKHLVQRGTININDMLPKLHSYVESMYDDNLDLLQVETLEFEIFELFMIKIYGIKSWEKIKELYKSKIAL